MQRRELKMLCRRIVVEGRHRFGQMVGIVSHVHDSKYEVFAASSLTGIPVEGDVFALDAVYCREVVALRTSKAITEIRGVPGMRLHPLYVEIPCEAYISSPIVVAGAVWGTLNFSGLERRETPFSAADIACNEAWAAQIAAAVVAAGGG